jgi:hypothetical protein
MIIIVGGGCVHASINLVAQRGGWGCCTEARPPNTVARVMMDTARAHVLSIINAVQTEMDGSELQLRPARPARSRCFGSL